MLMACSMLAGCGGKDKKKVMVCNPKDSYNANNSIEFVLDDDGKTIKKFIYQEGITKAFVDKWYPKEDKDEAFNKLNDKYQGLLEMMIKGNEKIEWIKGSMDSSKDLYTISTILAFDVSHKSFEANDDTLKYLSQLGLDKYYNKDEKRFEVDASIVEKSTADSWMPLKCTIKEVDKKE